MARREAIVVHVYVTIRVFPEMVQGQIPRTAGMVKAGVLPSVDVRHITLGRRSIRYLLVLGVAGFTRLSAAMC
jgi:hypothetical protein